MRPSVLTALVLLLAGTASASAQHPTVDFVTEILPILESRCIECHQAPRRLANGRMKRPKGRVRFDSVEAIRASKRGNLIVPGKPDESIALDVISLPADHDDRMPPASKGALVSEVDVERIKRWISQGVSRLAVATGRSGNMAKGSEAKAPVGTIRNDRAFSSVALIAGVKICW